MWHIGTVTHGDGLNKKNEDKVIGMRDHGFSFLLSIIPIVRKIVHDRQLLLTAYKLLSMADKPQFSFHTWQVLENQSRRKIPNPFKLKNKYLKNKNKNSNFQN